MACCLKMLQLPPAAKLQGSWTTNTTMHRMEVIMAACLGMVGAVQAACPTMPLEAGWAQFPVLCVKGMHCQPFRPSKV